MTEQEEEVFQRPMIRSRIVDPKGDPFSVFETRVQPSVKRQPIVQEVVVEKPVREKVVKKKPLGELSQFIIVYQGTGILAETLSRGLRDDRMVQVVNIIQGDVRKLQRKKLVSDDEYGEMTRLLGEISQKVKTEEDIQSLIVDFERILGDALEDWLNA